MTVELQLDLAASSRCQKLLERIPDLAWLMTYTGEIGGLIISANAILSRRIDALAQRLRQQAIQIRGYLQNYWMKRNAIAF
jgi:hypothetical protein